MFDFLERHYKVLITSLALLLAVGYVHKLCWLHKGDDKSEYGYYAYENWKEGKMRWTWRKAYTRIEAVSNLFGFRVVVAGYNSTGPEGLILKVFLDGEPLDRIHFFNGGNRYLYYCVPNIEGKEVEIGVEVDRTFNPFRMGINEDGRELGVAVSPITFLKIMPKDGVGFYYWEIWGGGEIPGWLESKEKRFRWTGMRASLPIGDWGKGGKKRAESREQGGGRRGGWMGGFFEV